MFCFCTKPDTGSNGVRLPALSVYGLINKSISDGVNHLLFHKGVVIGSGCFTVFFLVAVVFNMRHPKLVFKLKKEKKSIIDNIA